MKHYEKMLLERKKHGSKFYQQYGVTKRDIAKMFDVKVKHIHNAGIVDNGNIIRIIINIRYLYCEILYDYVNGKKIAKLTYEQIFYK